VVHGEYSDYQIDGVFENQKSAIKYVASYNYRPYDTKIEVWEDTKHMKTLNFDLDGKLQLDWENKIDERESLVLEE